VEDTDSEAAKEDNPSYLPAFLPTFGVSPATQAWIYGSAIVIVGFVGAIAFYLIRQRRKDKVRKQGMDYEFEALGADDLEEGPDRPAAAGGRRKARDLYDAFGASDDESDIFSGSEDSDLHEKGYYDEDEARGVDEGRRTGDKEKLLGRHSDR
jgi:kexin